ncbi:MAG: zf-HC2 domain-containing protein [Spirochaetales bacterium]|nr:zf-HC2 domain-containing protein [Spirochaetales bacterium]
MCPNEQILSAYFDNEIPAPWDAQVFEHISECPICKAKISSYRSLSTNMRITHDILEASIPESMDRVYSRILESRTDVGSKFWQRQVKIPIPFLAAAAAMVVFFGIGFMTGRGKVDSVSAVPLVEAEDSSEVLTVKLGDGDMAELADLLKNRDEQVQVFIELPPASFIDTVDESQLIRAADYRP